MADVAIAVGIVGAAIGAIAGGQKWQQENKALENDRDTIDRAIAAEQTTAALGGQQALENYSYAVGEAERARELIVGQAADTLGLLTGQATEARDLLTGHAAAGYRQSLAETAIRSGAERRASNISYLATEEAGVRTVGAAGAGLAASGVRRSGSAAAIMAESARMYEYDLGRIEADLAEREAAFGAERSGLGLQYNQALERFGLDYNQALERYEQQYGQAVQSADYTMQDTITRAGMGYEQSVESILGRDVSLEDLFAGDVDWTQTLLTEELGAQREDLQEELDWMRVEGKLSYVFGGALEGASFGLFLV